MAIECVEQQEWIEEEISKPVDTWVEDTQKKCKKRHWYDPRSWFCWLVTFFVKVIVWVVVKVGKWVVRTVCKVVGQIIDFLGDFFTGLWDVIVGIFTLDWRRILDGLIKIVAGFVDSLLKLLRVLFLLDTLDYIITEVQRNQLRAYVRTKLGFKYSGQEFQDIADNLRIDYGAFGYRINMRAIRTFLDSETPSPVEPGVPNLVVLNENGEINLRELCGFDFTEGFWNRKRYKTLKKGLHATGGGGGEVDNPISEDELDTYLSSRGAEGPKFIVLCMRDGVLDTKLRAAELKGRELGLMPKWKRETLAVTLPQHIKHRGTTLIVQSQELVKFLTDPINRKPKVHDNPATPTNEEDFTDALNDLCTPVAVGIFRYTETLRGITACLMESACGQGPFDVSGLTFIDNKPDIVWKYVPIHELGHYFGLCHVEGADRIMFTPKGPHGESLSTWEVIKKALTWRTLYSLLIIKGEPSFTLDEGMQAWDYIIEHFPARCLGSKTETPVIL
ncbi:MAG TPA: hypothetical protein VIF81_05020 [Pyrinomonadaceae bacterium]